MYIGSISGSRLAVFPNPVKDVVNILNPDGLQIREAQIYNSAGVELRRYAPITNSHTVSLNIGSLSNGLYALKVITDRGTEVLKILK